MYARVIKKTTKWASEESFTISAGNNVEFTSPKLSDNSERLFEICFPITSNHLYTLTMKDSSKDSWSSGAWIAIKDANDYTVFKGIMAFTDIEMYDFALYSPIMKNAEWKFTSTFEGGWNQYNHADSVWTSVTLGSTTQEVVGTQYFRKTFAGVSGMAAVITQFQYGHGIVAYINGVEIFRDNMPVGEVSQGTMASGSYASSEYHGMIRPAGVAESAQSVLAVELHFTEVTSRVIDFNAFVSYGAGISSDNNCFVSPIAVSASSTGSTTSSSLFDYTRNDAMSAYTLPVDVLASFNGNVIPIINSMRIWPLSIPEKSPKDFALAGASSTSSSSWTTIVNPSNQQYVSMNWLQINTIADPAYYKALKMTVTRTKSGSLTFYEAQFLVCNRIPVQLEYHQSSHSFYARRDVVSISSGVFGITSCQSNPPLPDGISVDSQCNIMGTATAATSATTYTITGSAGSNTVTGTITLTFTECQGTLLRILRTYKSIPGDEAFRIRDSVTDELLMEVAIGNTYSSYTDHVDYLCMTVDRFDVTVDGSSSFWCANSYIYVYAVLADNEEDLILKARFDNYQHNDNTYWLRRESITISEQWYYKMGDVPANWYDDNTSGWTQGNKGSFPASTNQIQLYKKTFSVSDLSVVSGLILNIRYKYGCVVYVNGNEAFRNHIGDGAISATTTATESYSEVKYHTLTLPGRFVNEDGSNPIALLKQGSNMIAIGLFAFSGQMAADFDATVRLMTNEAEAHIWDFTITASGISGTYTNAFDGYYGTTNSGSTCTNYITLTLDNDRREWVNMVQVQNFYDGSASGVARFNLYGRNSRNGEWTLLSAVSGLTYSMGAQKRSVYFLNRVPYNQFKFENFAPAGESSCSWGLQSLNLYATNIMTDVAPLTYPSNTVIFKNIEMSELIPEGDGYYDFSISPALPEGLSIDSSTGWVSGTYNNIMNPTQYTVTAHKKTGGISTASFSLSSEVCTGGRSLMTVRIRADGYPQENSWKLYEGRGTSGTVLRSVDMFPMKENYYYLDFCLNDGLYTFMGQDSFGDGWSLNTGYTLTADMGEMELDIEELWGQGDSIPKMVSTVFSTFFPFQVEYTEWKVYQSGEAPAGWNTASFNDGAWETKKAADIPNPTRVTTYIRKSFQLTNIDDYQVLNVRMKYAGGVVVYFNGNKVARFNLADEFDSDTESLEVHDSTVFSKFHIILVTAGIQEGTNVIAFEVHRPVGTSSSTPFVFDATGVFGVETCSTVVDSYASVTSTKVTSGSLAGIMDLNPFTVGTLPADPETFVEWRVENLEGSKWNLFNVVGGSDVLLWNFDLYGYMNSGDVNGVKLASVSESLRSRTKPQISVPVALASFRKVRYEILQASTGNMIGAMFTAYCKASGAVCPGVGYYPAVAEGQISPGPCGDGFIGYSYRNCSNGAFGEIQTDHCTYKAPAMVRYRSGRLTLVMGTMVSEKPTYRNIVTKWYLNEGVRLPDGLTLNQETGEISGIPTDTADMTSFTVYAENPNAAAEVHIDISVRKGRCNAEGVFPLTEVDQVAVYQCSMQGSYVGTQKRACVLGEKDGEWKKASGFCTSVGTIVILIVIVIIVVVVVVFMLMRAGRKSKAVGGVKGKKAVKTSPTTKKNDKKKNVKV